MNIDVREWKHDGTTVSALGDFEIHVWQWNHDAAFAHGGDLYAVLSDDERARAARFLVEEPRREFVATRATVRQVLGNYLNVAAKSLQFKYADRGKPSLANANNDAFQFNISHSGDISVLAIVRSREIGIDIEQIRPDVEASALAERFFSPDERNRLLKLHGEHLAHGFFRLWTRKEAYIKARGDGLSLALDSFDVSLEAGEQSALLHTRPDALQAKKWTVSDLHMPRGYEGALAFAELA